MAKTKMGKIHAILGRSTRSGRWRLGPKTSVIAVLGSCRLDLRDAHLDGDTSKMTATVFLGGVTIIIPNGVEVRPSGLSLLGGATVEVPVFDDGEAALIEIEWTSIFGRLRIGAEPVDAETPPGRAPADEAVEAGDDQHTVAGGSSEPVTTANPSPAPTAGTPEQQPAPPPAVSFDDLEAPDPQPQPETAISFDDLEAPQPQPQPETASDDLVVGDGTGHDRESDDPPPEPVDQPTDQTEDQPTNQAEGQPTDQAQDQPTDQTEIQPTDEAEDQPTDRAEDQPADEAGDQPTDQPAGEADDQPTDLAEDQTADEAGDQPTDQSEDQTEDQPTDRAEDQPTDRAGDEEEPAPVGVGADAT